MLIQFIYEFIALSYLLYVEDILELKANVSYNTSTEMKVCQWVRLIMIGGKRVATDNKPEKLTLTVSEAAGLLGLSRNTVYQGIWRNEIPYIKVGKRILIPREALRKMLEASNRQAVPGRS